MRQILKYPGAKARLADWIISYMPKHNVYVEPYAGSASILLSKARCHIETINDIDWEQAEAGHKRTETLWMNYKSNQMTLIDCGIIQN